jgi:hypothetical protein
MVNLYGVVCFLTLNSYPLRKLMIMNLDRRSKLQLILVSLSNMVKLINLMLFLLVVLGLVNYYTMMMFVLECTFTLIIQLYLVFLSIVKK